MSKIKLLIALLVASFALSGCAGMNSKLNKESFAANKKPRMAIMHVIGRVDGLTMSDEEEQQLFNGAARIVEKELAKSKHFTLVKRKHVAKSRAYKAIKAQPPKFGIFSLELAKGYKYFDIKEEKENMAKLAKELKLDGVMIVNLTFNRSNGGFSLGGFLPIPIPITVGKSYGELSYAVHAMDPKTFDVIWGEVAKESTEEGVTTVMGVGKFSDLQPKLLNLTRNVSVKLIHDLDENLKI